jgi:hypothetical protein
MAEHYKGHRSGSRKAVIRRTLDERGEEAAIAQGAELKLAPATVRGWIATWKRGGAPTKSDEAPTRPRASAKVDPNATRICLKGEPDMKGRLITQGDEQSVVRWDNGNENVVVNEWIEKI